MSRLGGPSRSWSERRSRQGTLDDREVAHMAESPRLVVVPTSPHRRPAEAVALAGTPLGQGEGPGPEGLRGSE